MGNPVILNSLLKEIKKIGGQYLLESKGSFFELITETYPEYNWLPWKFNTFSSKSLVINPNKRQQYVKWLSNQLNIKEMDDWYKIKPEVKILCKRHISNL